MRRINTIDLVKFVLSFFVICLHTFYLTTNNISDIKFLTTIFHLAVPFFFISASFLLFKKVSLPLNKNGSKTILKYLKRIFIIYLIWTIIYLPIAVYGAIISGATLKEFIMYSLRKFIFVGESYYSWQLWYLHGLIISILMVFFLLKIKVKPQKILIIGIIVFIFGVLLNIVLKDNITNFPLFFQKILNMYTYLFERVRNGIFKGFVYVTIGLYLSTCKNIDLKTGLILFISGFIFYYLGIETGLILFASGFFMIACNINILPNKDTFYFRKISTYIFLVHMIFVFVYLVLIKQNKSYNYIDLFLFTSFCSYLLANIIYFTLKIIDNLKCKINKTNYRS